MKWFKVSRKSKSDLFFDVLIYGFAILLILLIVYPLWFVVIASFSNPADVANGKVWFIPHEWKLDGYLRLIEQPLFLKKLSQYDFIYSSWDFICSTNQYPCWIRII